jgi:hypothetical protein
MRSLIAFLLVVACLESTTAVEAPTGRPVWEYLVVTVDQKQALAMTFGGLKPGATADDMSKHAATAITELLNGYGRDGWRLVASDSGGMVFMREKVSAAPMGK